MSDDVHLSYDRTWSAMGERILFGADPHDYGDIPPIEWFHQHHARFLFPIERITASRTRYDPAHCNDYSEGVYFLFEDDKLQYVGQSRRIANRLDEHLYPAPRCEIPVAWITHYVAIWVPREVLDPVESYYLHLLTPPRNIRFLPVHTHVKRYLPR